MKLLPALRNVRWRKTFHCLKRVRFLHVMHNDKFNAPFIDLVRTHFQQDGHVFVFFGGCEENEFRIPELDNVVALRDRSQLWILGLFIRKAERIFFHSFLVHATLRYAGRFRSHLGKASWIVWGADLYGDREIQKARFHKDKKEAVRSLGAVIVVAPGDLGVVRKQYDFRGPGYYGLYRLPVRKDLLDRCASRAQPDGSEKPLSDDYVIQLNNCCDESVLSGLEQLKRFRNQPVRIRTILSYGDLSLKDQIIDAGNKLFGDRFVPITEYLPPEKYAALICDARVLIMNQPRQQGLGNIYGFLYAGAKVYIRSDVTTWDFLRERGFVIFDTLTLQDETFEDTMRVEEKVKLRNREVATQMLDDAYIARLWGEIFANRAPAILERSHRVQSLH